MKLVLFYDLAPDYLDRRPQFRTEHLELARQAHERGDLSIAGALDSPADRAVLVWDTDDESVVRAFVETDPYVANGLVTGWTIRQWNVVIE